VVKGKGKMIKGLMKRKGTVVKGKGKMVKDKKGKVVKGKGKVIKAAMSKVTKSKAPSKATNGKGNVIKVARSKVTKSKVPSKATNGKGKVIKVAPSKVARSKVTRSKVTSMAKNGCNIIYARVSSSKQADRAGFKRQQERCAARAGKATTVNEVVSGSLPAAKRTQLVEILTKHRGKKVYIESPRALARSTVAGEQLYEMSRENNVQIVSVDMPELFDHKPSAGTAFLRRVMLAAQEFERDIIVERLQHGLARAKAKSRMRTQSGAIKVQGSKSTLEQIKPNRATIAKIRAIVNKGWSQRMIRDYIRVLLKRPNLGTSTAMRILSEVKYKP
jgi:DNA invertase Pin-like site-specific DNA recombinase